MESVRSMSSRVQLTPRKAVFTYSYSDFRYDAEEVLLDYFDFMLYITNWGTKRIMMKFPKDIVDYEKLKTYRISVESDYVQEIRVLKKSGFVLLDIYYSEEEGMGWIDEGDYAYDFLNIRSEIINEDYRALFFIWLKFLEDLYKSSAFDHSYSFGKESIPANLIRLNASCHAVKDFYGINTDWYNAVLPYSESRPSLDIDYESLLLHMSKERMIEYLKMVIKGEPNVGVRLTKELRKNKLSDTRETGMITLLNLGDKVSQIRQARLQKEQAEEERRNEQRMNVISNTEEQIKQGVLYNIKQGNPKAYDLAVTNILELKSMYEYFNDIRAFDKFMEEVHSISSRRTAFKRRLIQNGLIE